MATLDPFVIQWPDKWMTDPEIAPVINYLNLFLQNLLVALDNGNAIDASTEAAEDNNNQIASVLSKISQIESKLDTIEEDIIPLQKQTNECEPDMQVIDLSRIKQQIKDIEAQL